MVVQAAAAQPAPGPASPPQAGPPAAARPKVGLVLGGGGARGAAHIGVLEVLERLRVPVDCVAGTSMGALVAGAWAAGLSPQQMRDELARADWADMFQDNPDYAELNHRNKRLSQRFLPGSETGVSMRGAITPPGVVSAQKIKLFFNRLVRADAGERRLEELPLPVSIVATDIGTGERVVLREGSLTTAMRASMSVPGLMAPLEAGGRKLVDGGLVDNLPVREVRERCGAEVVIAVNVGTTPLPPDEVRGLLTVSAQVIALLTEQNVQATLATLTPRDIVIQPELGPVTAADLEHHAQAADRGREAAQEQAPRLRELAVDEAAWQRWRQQRVARLPERPRIDEVQVAGLSLVSEAVVRRYLLADGGRAARYAGARPGAWPRLRRRLVRARGLRRAARRRAHRAARDAGGEGLGPGLPAPGPAPGRQPQPAAASPAPGLPPHVAVAAGRRTAGGGRTRQQHRRQRRMKLQPLSADRLWFADFEGGYKRERSDYFFMEQRMAEYRSVRTRLQATAGLNVSLVGTLSGGWRETRVASELETGVDILAQLPRERGSGGWLVALDFDRMDRLYFPRRGWSAEAEWYGGHARGEGSDYQRASFDLRGAAEWRDNVLGARLAWVGSPRGALPLHDAGRLGGFLNLTAFASGQLIGDDVAYAHLRGERIIGRLPLGLRGDMRVGLALESGKVATPYTTQKRNGWLHSLAAYLGGETPFGPVYLGIGFGSGRTTNAYLFIGTP
ncbi:MAG: patatin-like phospholipase family protein [Rubrivivax sp.]